MKREDLKLSILHKTRLSEGFEDERPVTRALELRPGESVEALAWRLLTSDGIHYARVDDVIEIRVVATPADLEG